MSEGRGKTKTLEEKAATSLQNAKYTKYYFNKEGKLISSGIVFNKERVQQTWAEEVSKGEEPTVYITGLRIAGKPSVLAKVPQLAEMRTLDGQPAQSYYDLLDSYGSILMRGDLDDENALKNIAVLEYAVQENKTPVYFLEIRSLTIREYLAFEADVHAARKVDEKSAEANKVTFTIDQIPAICKRMGIQSTVLDKYEKAGAIEEYDEKIVAVTRKAGTIGKVVSPGEKGRKSTPDTLIGRLDKAVSEGKYFNITKLNDKNTGAQVVPADKVATRGVTFAKYEEYPNLASVFWDPKSENFVTSAPRHFLEQYGFASEDIEQMLAETVSDRFKRDDVPKKTSAAKPAVTRAQPPRPVNLPTPGKTASASSASAAPAAVRPPSPARNAPTSATSPTAARPAASRIRRV